MDVVWHNNVFTNSRNGAQVFFNNSTYRCKYGARGDVGIAPYDGT